MWAIKENEMDTKFIEVVHYDTGVVAYRSDVTDRSDRQIEKIQNGLLINLHESYVMRVMIEEGK